MIFQTPLHVIERKDMSDEVTRRVLLQLRKVTAARGYVRGRLVGFVGEPPQGLVPWLADQLNITHDRASRSVTRLVKAGLMEAPAPDRAALAREARPCRWVMLDDL